MIRSALLPFLFAIFAASAARAELLVFAAASLKEPLDKIAADYGDVVVSYGGSGTLARQISLGAPADVVLLANTQWMEHLVSDGHVVRNSVTDFASNSLVVVAKTAVEPFDLTAENLITFIGNGRLAVGLTNAVPAGQYAKQALQWLGAWEDVQLQLAEVDNVRAALALVVRGQAPLGIVYETDARIGAQVHVVASFPATSHTPIRYTAAAVTATAEGQSFLNYLTSEAGQDMLMHAGFLPPLEASE